MTRLYSNFLDPPQLSGAFKLASALVYWAVHRVLNNAMRMMYGNVGYQGGFFNFIIILALSISPLYVVPPAVTPANDLGNQDEEDSQDNEDVSDGERLAWIQGMEQSPSWIHERIFAQMLAFDSTTDEGMSDFHTFIKTVERGGTGKQRDRPGWVTRQRSLAEENGVKGRQGLGSISRVSC